MHNCCRPVLSWGRSTGRIKTHGISISTSSNCDRERIPRQQDLGILEARSGDRQDAVQLWQQAFDRVPYRSAIGTDLAIAFCAANQKDEARHYIERVLEFNPDCAIARRMLTRLDANAGECKPQSKG
jgi:hypothetical protein